LEALVPLVYDELRRLARPDAEGRPHAHAGFRVRATRRCPRSEGEVAGLLDHLGDLFRGHAIRIDGRLAHPGVVEGFVDQDGDLGAPRKCIEMFADYNLTRPDGGVGGHTPRAVSPFPC